MASLNHNPHIAKTFKEAREAADVITSAAGWFEDQVNALQNTFNDLSAKVPELEAKEAEVADRINGVQADLEIRQRRAEADFNIWLDETKGVALQKLAKEAGLVVVDGDEHEALKARVEKMEADFADQLNKELGKNRGMWESKLAAASREAELTATATTAQLEAKLSTAIEQNAFLKEQLADARTLIAAMRESNENIVRSVAGGKSAEVYVGDNGKK